MTEACPAADLTRRQLYDLVWNRPLKALAQDFGITGNGLAKICDRLLIPSPPPGHWRKAPGQRQAPAALPPAPPHYVDPIQIAGTRAKSRRPRTRMPREERREQLMTVAARVIEAEGLHAVSMKRVAREAGVSEAQAHNCFEGFTDLLTSLAVRELAAVDTVRQSEVDRGKDQLDRTTLSIVTYLHQVERRGALIQTLIGNPDVRTALRGDYQARRSESAKTIGKRLAEAYDVLPDVATAATGIFSAITLRAGRLLSRRKASLEMTERLTLAIILSGNRAIFGSRRGQTSGGQTSGAGD